MDFFYFLIRASVQLHFTICYNYLVDYYYKLKEPPYSKKDLVAQIACVNHLNRTIMYLVHTNQSYDYQQAVRQ